MDEDSVNYHDSVNDEKCCLNEVTSCSTLLLLNLLDHGTVTTRTKVKVFTPPQNYNDVYSALLIVSRVVGMPKRHLSLYSV